jgi:glycosyltransferase involved in cell wall biosynthesis
MYNSKRVAIMVTSYPGDPSVEEYERSAASGVRPRKDYVELARALDAEVIDWHYMMRGAVPPARAIMRAAGMPPAQIAEVFLRQRRYDHVLAWADRLGLGLAFLLKVTRSRLDLVLLSALLTKPEKLLFLKHLRVHSHLRAIIGRRWQMEIAAGRLGVPRDKLSVIPRPVDDRFFSPTTQSPDNLICGIGWEARDYLSLVEAIAGMDLNVELAIGSTALPTVGSEKVPLQPRSHELVQRGVPANVRLSRLNQQEIRALYARSRFVVIPTEDVDFDAGVTSLVEAMAMGKAVVATATRGLADLFEDGIQGIYVPPYNPSALRTVITHLLDHPEEADRMGRAGRALVEQRHTLDGVVAQLAATMRGAEAVATDGEPVQPHGHDAYLQSVSPRAGL